MLHLQRALVHRKLRNILTPLLEVKVVEVSHEVQLVLLLGLLFIWPELLKMTLCFSDLIVCTSALR